MAEMLIGVWQTAVEADLSQHSVRRNVASRRFAERVSFRRASIDGAAILEKPVSDLGTLEDLSQSAESAAFGDRKLLILNGEMLERSIRHAWKTMRWSHVETYRSTFLAAPSLT